jgi:hypothetical protein
VLGWFHVGIRASAFKHGQSREDILHAVRRRLAMDDINDWLGERQIRLIGPNLAGHLIVVMATQKSNRLVVFHAQPLKPGRSRKGVRHDN